MTDKTAYAAEVAAQLYELEAAIDAAVRRAALFTGTLASAGAQAGFSAVVGQGVMESVAEASSVLVQARKAACRAHTRLADLSRATGLTPPVMEYPVDKPPPEGRAPEADADVVRFPARAAQAA